jgi:tRNA-dihydrouridine synthase C
VKDFFGPSSPDRVMLAPMEGVVDAPMRDVLTSIGGVDLCVTEFIRVTDRLLPESEFFKDCPELRLGDQTRAGVPVVVQLLGGVPSALGENAARAVSLGACGIDLNFGCPAKTVNRHDGGATLLKNPSRIFEVVSEVRRAVGDVVPVSAKVRLGFSDKEFVLDISRAAASAGAAWLVVHARTRDEGYRPPAYWDFIARMASVAGSMPVIANGEMWTLSDIARARAESGCRHIMLGRGLLADPFLAREFKGGARGTWPEAFVWFNRFIEMSQAEGRHAGYASARAKQWLKSLGRRFPEAAAVFEEIKRLDLAHDILCVVEQSCEPGYTVSNRVTEMPLVLEGV